MLKRKRIRDKGKISLTKIFQKFDSGDSVAIVMELGAQSPGFPKRMQGRTGRVVEKKGSAYVVEVMDYNMKKQFSIKPVHLKRIKETR
jgi:large subunit ribosomal protein L21e